MCASHRYVDLDNKIVLTISAVVDSSSLQRDSFSEAEVVDQGDFDFVTWDAHKLKMITIQRGGTPVRMR